MEAAAENTYNGDQSERLLSIMENAQNCQFNEDEDYWPIDCCFLYSLLVCSLPLYRSRWCKFKQINRLLSRWPYETEMTMSAAQWVECVMILMKLPMAEQIPVTYYKHSDDRLFFKKLLYNMSDCGVCAHDKANVIKAFLDLDVQVFSKDIHFVLWMDGYDEVLEAVIFHPRESVIRNLEFAGPLESFIFCWEHKINSQVVDSLLQQFMKNNSRSNSAALIQQLRYFSYSAPTKRLLQEDIRLRWNPRKIYRVLNKIPTCPTLLELSRNCAYNRVVKYQTGRWKAADLHNTILSLNIPMYFKDVLRFKQPLYC